MSYWHTPQQQRRAQPVVAIPGRQSDATVIELLVDVVSTATPHTHAEQPYHIEEPGASIHSTVQAFPLETYDQELNEDVRISSSSEGVAQIEEVEKEEYYDEEDEEMEEDEEGEEGGEEIEDCPDANSSLKRKRKGVPIEVKKEIIRFHQENPLWTNARIGNKFGRPRTTIAGIIEKKDKILSYTPGTLVGSTKKHQRIVKPRSAKVEDTLAFWMNDQMDRGIPISDSMIRTQAVDIHKFMAIYLGDNLAPCDYTTSWLKGFKGRHGDVMKRRPSLPAEFTQIDKAAKKCTVEYFFQGYEPETVYVCDLTSMYIDDDTTTMTAPRNMLPSEVDGDAIEVNDQTSADIERRIMELEAKAMRVLLVVMNQTIWEAICHLVYERKLNYVLPINAPEQLSAELSLSKTVMKELKAYYHTRHFLPTQGISQSPEEHHSKLIISAWRQISQSFIENSLQGFREAAGTSERNISPPNSPAKDIKGCATAQLQKVLKKNPPKFKRSEYYTMQDGDTGPSSSIRAYIQDIFR
ncbi:hypothetical protein BGX27_009095 [Mortierella sp. AM989]|nr:hypothetical protein BGX27_009095 [Mortierella sp. AM989]